MSIQKKKSSGSASARAEASVNGGAVKKKTTKAAAGATGRKAPAKKAPARQAPAKKAPAKRRPAKKAAAKKAPAKKTPAKKTTAAATRRGATAGKAAAPRSGLKKASATKTATRKASGSGTSARGPRGSGLGPASRTRSRGVQATRPSTIAGLAEEDQIRAAKFIPREPSAGPFEEERFLFPESYGVDRVRLLVRDPEWIFAYWDVSSDSMKDLVRSLGERAYALSRLTLRVHDPVSGGQSDILLPPGARWWYIRSDVARRTYRAEIGVTLPSGAFRRLAESNTVVTPRVGPSRENAQRQLSYREAGEVAAAEAAAAGRADRQSGLASRPWAAGRSDAAARGERGGASDSFRPGGKGPDRGGASDVFGPGASDTHRR